MAYLPGIQYKTGTTELGGGGTDPNAKPQDYGVTAPPPPASDLVSDNGTSRDDEVALSATLKNLATRAPFDDSYIRQQEEALAKRREETEKSINASFDTTKTGLETQQKNETGSTSAMLARAGGYLGSSGSGTGVLMNLSQSHRAEMQGLESKRQAALNEARSAYEDKQFALAKERVAEAKKYEQESYDRQQAYFTELKKETDRVKAAEEEQTLNIDIYNALAEGATDEMSVFEKLGGKASPERIRTFFDKIKPKTAATAVYKFTNDEVGKLLGAGLTPPEMQAFSDDLNKYGYAKAIEGLSGRQRTIVDEILNGKPTSGVTNGLTLSEALRLGLPPSLIGKPEKEFLSELGSNTPPDWFIEYVGERYGEDVSQYPKKDFDLPGRGDETDLKVPQTVPELWKSFRENVISQFTGEEIGGSGKPKAGGGGLDGLSYDGLDSGE